MSAQAVMGAHTPLPDDGLEEAILDWVRARFDRWPIEALHIDSVSLAATLGVSRKRVSRAIRALTSRHLIEPVLRTEEEVAAGVPFLHRLVE